MYLLFMACLINLAITIVYYFDLSNFRWWNLDCLILEFIRLSPVCFVSAEGCHCFDYHDEMLNIQSGLKGTLARECSEPLFLML